MLVLLSTLCPCDLVQSALGTRRHGNWWFLLQYIQVHILGLSYAWKFPVKIFIYEKGTHTHKATPDTFRDRKQKDTPMQDDLSAYPPNVYISLSYMRSDLLHFYLAVATKQQIPCGVAKLGRGRWESYLLWLVCRCNVGLSAKWQKWAENLPLGFPRHTVPISASH